MAITVVGTEAAAGNGGNPGSSSITTSFTLHATADFLLAGVSWQDPAQRTVSSGTPPTWNGVALTQVTGALKQYLNVVMYQDVDFWYLFAPATGANNLVTTMSGTCRSLVHGVIGFNGAHQTTAPAFKASSSHASANPASIATTSTAGNIVVGLINPYTDTATNITSNNTEAWEYREVQQESQIANCSYDTATSPTISWINAASVPWAATTIEVSAAGGGGGSVMPIIANHNMRRRA